MQWWLNILHESRLDDLVHDGGYGNDNSGGVGGSGGDGGVAKVALVALAIVAMAMGGRWCQGGNGGIGRIGSFDGVSHLKNQMLDIHTYINLKLDLSMHRYIHTYYI